MYNVMIVQKKGINNLKQFWNHLDEQYFRDVDLADARVSLDELIKSVATPIESGDRYIKGTLPANNLNMGGNNAPKLVRQWYNNRATPKPTQTMNRDLNSNLGFIQNEDQKASCIRQGQLSLLKKISIDELGFYDCK